MQVAHDCQRFNPGFDVRESMALLMIRCNPASAQFRIPGSSPCSACSRSLSSLPNHDRVVTSMMKRPMIAADASPSLGNSFEMM